MTDPRPLREGDTLGRAGRVSAKGNPVEVQRNRAMTPEDARHATIEVAGVEDPRLIITSLPPATDGQGEPLPVVQHGGGHRGLLHLDGKGEPRPPEAWERANAEIRAGKFAGEKDVMLRDLQRRRDVTPLESRIAHLQRRALTMHVPRAKRVAPTDADARPGAQERDLSPQGEGHGAIGYANEREVDLRWLQIERHVEAIERAFDAHDGLPAVSLSMMTDEAKDLWITGPKFRGLSPVQISAIEPELGVPKTISFVRRCAEQKPDGTPAPRDTEAAA